MYSHAAMVTDTLDDGGCAGFLTAKRSPTTPRMNVSPLVAP
jgi:hypothetical protein